MWGKYKEKQGKDCHDGKHSGDLKKEYDRKETHGGLWHSGPVLVFALDGVLVTAITKYHSLSGLISIYFLTFWRLEVQDQGAITTWGLAHAQRVSP